MTHRCRLESLVGQLKSSGWGWEGSGQLQEQVSAKGTRSEGLRSQGGLAPTRSGYGPTRAPQDRAHSEEKLMGLESMLNWIRSNAKRKNRQKCAREQNQKISESKLPFFFF